MHSWFKRLAVTAVFMGCLGFMLFPVQITHAVDNLGVFELDHEADGANPYDETKSDPLADGDDWDTLVSGGGSAVEFSFQTDPFGETIFGGGRKDIQFIADWKHKSGSVPPKDEITNAYAAAYNVDGDLVLYTGADRLTTNGDAQMGFWFFQDAVGLNANGTFSGEHQVGDLLMLVNFEQGGTIPTIQVLEWVGSGGDQQGGTLNELIGPTQSVCVGTGPLACAITNGITLSPTPWPYQSGESGVPANTFLPQAFFEGGLNVTQAFQSAGLDVPCFASFMVETRSSSSVTATLKDFVLGSFPVCSLELIKNCTNGRIVSDPNDGFLYDFSGTVTNSGFGTLYNVTVVDETPEPDQTFDIGTLQPGESANFSGTFFSTVNGPTNVANANGTTNEDPNVGTVVNAPQATADCPPVDANPAIAVTKDCNVVIMPMDGKLAVQVNFSGTVSNTGDVTLFGVTVTDDSGTPGDTSDDQTFNLGDIPVEGMAGYSGSYLPVATDTGTTDPSNAMFTDEVTAEGTTSDVFGSIQVMSEAVSATCDLCPEP